VVHKEERADDHSSLYVEIAKFIYQLTPLTCTLMTLRHGCRDGVFHPVKFHEDWMYARDPTFRTEADLFQKMCEHDQHQVMAHFSRMIVRRGPMLDPRAGWEWRHQGSESVSGSVAVPPCP